MLPPDFHGFLNKKIKKTCECQVYSDIRPVKCYNWPVRLLYSAPAPDFSRVQRSISVERPSLCLETNTLLRTPLKNGVRRTGRERFSFVRVRRPRPVRHLEARVTGPDAVSSVERWRLDPRRPSATVYGQVTPSVCGAFTARPVSSEADRFRRWRRGAVAVQYTVATTRIFSCDPGTRDSCA